MSSTNPGSPPPTEGSGRSRSNTTNSLMSSSAGIPAAPYNTPTPSIVQGDLSSLSKPAHLECLTKIQEETPGTFFEADTAAPENTPTTSVRGLGSPDCNAPRTKSHATVIHLPEINERLEQLPPPASSKWSTPTQSIAEDVQSKPFVYMILIFSPWCSLKV
jgi:hypothetical protein